MTQTQIKKRQVGGGTSGKVTKWDASDLLADSIISDDGSKITLPAGTGINEFSIDVTLVGNSDDALPTEKAVKTYVDGQILPGSGHVIEDATIVFPHQDFLQLLGDVTVTDDDPNNRTIVTISGVESALVTKGDILVRDVTTTTRLGVGGNDEVIIADSAESVGMRWGAAPAGTPANPTTNVGLIVDDGVLTTYMRSDGAPALSQAIVPTWTGKHTFDRTFGVTNLEKGVEFLFDNAGAAAATILQYGMNIQFDNAVDGDAEQVSVYGIQSKIIHSTAYAGHSLRCFRGSVSKSGVGTVTRVDGLYALVNCSGGTITAVHGAYIDVINSATITTAYGLYIGTVTGTTEYGIYQSDTSNDNYFAGTISQAAGKHIATSEVRAASAAGLKLYEDGGKGIFVQNNTGYAGIGGVPEVLLTLSHSGGARLRWYDIGGTANKRRFEITHDADKTWMSIKNNAGATVYDTIVIDASTGSVKLASLAGAGSRTVKADANGVLSAP